MLHFRYHSTNCFFIESATSSAVLAIDAGWPCTLREYQRQCKALGLRFDRIEWAMVTHFHMDHAGLLTDFVDSGIICYVFENQPPAIAAMEATILKTCPDYRRIDTSKLKIAYTEDSRSVFAHMGIDGEAMIAGSHSPDSIMFLIDGTSAIVGDLRPLEQVMPDDSATLGSWKMLKEKGVHHIFPSHAEALYL